MKRDHVNTVTTSSTFSLHAKQVDVTLPLGAALETLPFVNNSSASLNSSIK